MWAPVLNKIVFLASRQKTAASKIFYGSFKAFSFLHNFNFTLFHTLKKKTKRTKK